ncbi:FGGY-family carbohydrate kinase [Georgenia wangjunii]|uniref:FGGY-family carbohydrate kinase n=1 Tax=Georgenia wangjunii TaxID=3117730 RepID=UPI002F261925
MRSLGLDVGSTNVKAVLVEIDADGGVRDVASASVPTPAGAAALVTAALRLVAAAVEAGGAPACVGVASMAETGVPLDGDGVPLGDLVRWDPRRAEDEAARLAAELGRGELFRATGVRPSGKAPLATWAYLRAREPDRWAAMDRWAGAADLLVHALTGRLVTDHTLAGRTMAYRLPGPGEEPARTFDRDLLAAVGLRPEQLPDVAAPGEVAARVGAAGSAGLAPGTPVVVAGHDHPVGAWAGGVRAPGEVADSLGTAEAVVRVVAARPDPDAVAAAGMSLVRTVAGDQDAVVAGSSSAGAMVAWWAERAGADRPFSEVLAAAAERPRHAASPLVLPYLRGRQTPAPDPDARVRVVGRTDAHDAVDLAAALVDGLALQARWMLVEQARLAGADPAAGEVLVLGGAAAASPAWLRAKAAAGPAPVGVLTAREPVAVGAALLAAHRAGLAPAVVLPRTAGPVPPDPGYDRLFHRFVDAAREGER